MRLGYHAALVQFDRPDELGQGALFFGRGPRRQLKNLPVVEVGERVVGADRQRFFQIVAGHLEHVVIEGAQTVVAFEFGHHSRELRAAADQFAGLDLGLDRRRHRPAGDSLAGHYLPGGGAFGAERFAPIRLFARARDLRLALRIEIKRADIEAPGSEIIEGAEDIVHLLKALDDARAFRHESQARARIELRRALQRGIEFGRFAGVVVAVEHVFQAELVGLILLLFVPRDDGVWREQLENRRQPDRGEEPGRRPFAERTGGAADCGARAQADKGADQGALLRLLLVEALYSALDYHVLAPVVLLDVSHLVAEDVGQLRFIINHRKQP